MARLASIEKGGYYPIPPTITEHIARIVVAPKGGRVLDDCAGKGKALITLAHKLGLEPYAAELHTERARELLQAVNALLKEEEWYASLKHKDRGRNRVLVGESYEAIKLRKGGIQFLYLNPPYDDGPDGQRLEYIFLKRSTFWLQTEGILAFVIPQYILKKKDIANYLASWYDRVDVLAFPEPYYEQFKQVVVFGIKKPKQTNVVKKVRDRLLDIGLAVETDPGHPWYLTSTLEAAEGADQLSAAGGLQKPYEPYVIPAPEHKQISFAGLFLPEEVMEEEHRLYGCLASDEYAQLMSPISMDKKRPLMPFKIGHMGSLISGGLLNNVTLTGDNEEIIIKGRDGKERKVAEEEHTNEQGTTIRKVTTSREVPILELYTMNTRTGAIDQVKPAETADFLLKWLPQLTTAINADYEPHYKFNLGKYKDRIGNRATLFPAQKHIVAAIATRLETHKDAIIVGEMGVGKTRIGAVLIAAAQFRRVVIVVPPHLVKKWLRETQLALPEANVIPIDTIGDVDAWMAQDEQKQIQVGVLKYTSARSASGWTHSYRTTLNCPFSEAELDELIDYINQLDAEENAGAGEPQVRAPYRPDLNEKIPIYIRWKNKVKQQALRDSHMGKELKGKKGELVTWEMLDESAHQHAHTTKPKQYTLSKERQRYVPFYQYKRFDEENTSLKECLARWDRNRRNGAYDGNTLAQDMQATRDGISKSRTPQAILRPQHRGRWRIADYLKKKYKGQIDCAIFDEAHMAKGHDTDQGYALGRIAAAARKTVLMTGTIYGGRSSTLFHLLYRTASDVREAFTDKAASGSSRVQLKKWVDRFGMWEYRHSESYDNSSGVNSGNKRVTETKKEAPGSSPAMLPWLLERTAFLSLADLELELPDYTEIPVAVEPTAEQMAGLDWLEARLGSEMRQRLARGDRSLLGIYLQANLCWPDSPWRDEIIIDPKSKKAGNPKELLRIDKLEPGIYPKEQAIIDLIQDEVFTSNRKVLLLCQQTRIRDITPEWMKLLQDAGLKPVTLNSQTVSTARREKWIRTQVKKGINVLITHPKAVEVGLDLLDFPTIIWMGTEYSVYTIMQASRRSFRIGQDKPIKVYYFYYAETLQEIAVGLIAQKTAAAIRVNGDVIAEDSLAAADAGSIEDALGRMVTQDKTAQAGLITEFFAQAKRTENQVRGYIGDYTIPEEKEMEEIVIETYTETDQISILISNARQNIERGPIEIAPDEEFVAVSPDEPTKAPTGQTRLVFGMTTKKHNKRKSPAKNETLQMSLFVDKE